MYDPYCFILHDSYVLQHFHTYQSYVHSYDLFLWNICMIIAWLFYDQISTLGQIRLSAPVLGNKNFVTEVQKNCQKSFHFYIRQLSLQETVQGNEMREMKNEQVNEKNSIIHLAKERQQDRSSKKNEKTKCAKKLAAGSWKLRPSTSHATNKNGLLRKNKLLFAPIFNRRGAFWPRKSARPRWGWSDGAREAAVGGFSGNPEKALRLQMLDSWTWRTMKNCTLVQSFSKISTIQQSCAKFQHFEPLSLNYEDVIPEELQYWTYSQVAKKHQACDWL